MSDLEIRSLGMVASRMLTNYIKTKERDDQGRPTEVEDDEYFDPSYLEVRYCSIEGLALFLAVEVYKACVAFDVKGRRVAVGYGFYLFKTWPAYAA